MDIHELIRTRCHSMRVYQDGAVPQDVLGRVLASTRWAPSTRTLQPWRLIPVRAEGLRHKLTLARAPASAAPGRASRGGEE